MEDNYTLDRYEIFLGTNEYFNPSDAYAKQVTGLSNMYKNIDLAFYLRDSYWSSMDISSLWLFCQGNEADSTNYRIKR